jgi:hypothetical protein
MRVRTSGLPHPEQGGRRLSTKLKSRGSVTLRSKRRRLRKCESDQARAKQDETRNGHGEEAVRSKFFTHGTPPIVSPCSNRTTTALHSQSILRPHCQFGRHWCFNATPPTAPEKRKPRLGANGAFFGEAGNGAARLLDRSADFGKGSKGNGWARVAGGSRRGAFFVNSRHMSELADDEFKLLLAQAFDRAWKRYYRPSRVGAISASVARPALDQGCSSKVAAGVPSSGGVPRQKMTAAAG